METLDAQTLVNMWNALVTDNNALWTFYILVLAAIFAFAFSSHRRTIPTIVRIFITAAFLIFVISNIASHIGHIWLVNNTLDAIAKNDKLKQIFRDVKIPVLGNYSFRVSYVLVCFIHLSFDTAAFLSLWPELLNRRKNKE